MGDRDDDRRGVGGQHGRRFAKRFTCGCLRRVHGNVREACVCTVMTDSTALQSTLTLFWWVPSWSCERHEGVLSVCWCQGALCRTLCHGLDVTSFKVHFELNLADFEHK